MKRLVRVLLALSLSLPLPASVAQVPTSTPAKNAHALSVQADQGNPDVRVWVNTASGVYHCPDTRRYGATKHGTYMRQADAQKKGYRPAYGRVCR
jgi:hypothetical protein